MEFERGDLHIVITAIIGVIMEDGVVIVGGGEITIMADGVDMGIIDTTMDNFNLNRDVSTGMRI